MREAMAELGGDPKKINPLVPTELVIDHSVIVDVFGAPDAFEKNAALEFERNQERYQFLRWGQNAFDGFKVVPPDTGIVHQVNLEYLARVVFDADGDGVPRHPRRHRLAHHDDQRPRRPRLGRRRHRGRGRDARPAGVDADPAGRRLQALRRAAGGHDRDRPRADHHRDAAQARRGRQVRRVLRAGRRRGAAGQPRHDRQHEPGVRLDLRDLPDRRRDADLPAAHRPRRRARRAGRGLRQGAGPVARPGPRAGLLRAARARPVDGRAVARRAEAAAGPGPAEEREGRLPRRRWPTTPTTTTPTNGNSANEGSEESFPASDPPAVSHNGAHDGPHDSATSSNGRPSNPATDHPRRRDRSRSTTARSSSPRSRPARTPPTRS